MIDWQRIWNDNENIKCFSPSRVILLFLSLFYRLVVELRNQLYNKNVISSSRLMCPVISVGNVTVGGTGKTPCVIMLAKILQTEGFLPAVISRGYGGRNTGGINIVSDGENIMLDAKMAGDEPILMAQSLPGVPVITGARRKKTGKFAIERFGANVIICDDAFQHRQIARDIDLVLLDYKKPFGNGCLLPAGPLRESVKGLSRAHCLMLTRAEGEMEVSEEVATIMKDTNTPLFYSAHEPQSITQAKGKSIVSMDNLKGKKVCAFCGIANPDSFKNVLLGAEVNILSFNPFPDHYSYTTYDLEELKKQFVSARADYLITTEKDAARLQAYPKFLETLWILRITMKIKPTAAEPLFKKFILKCLKESADKK
ncbi:MAG: tetraacyldisaccharide 4'-kinase [Syntrophaceae bacterium]|nr:tetraacyldisaccharide 4'-kinase [Syntrophaceae bacterium]